MKIKIIFVFLFSSAFAFSQIFLEEAYPYLSFSSPVEFQYAGDNSNRIFVVEQKGIIKVFPNDHEINSAKIFLNIEDSILSGGELGLLGLAFHPDFENNGYFYINYTKDNPRRTIVSRIKVSNTNPDSADISSELILLQQNQPFRNHNGGKLAFGPDGYLYIGFGDGGDGGDPQNNGQNLKTFLGKILRINVDSTQDSLNYSIPQDNPFKGNTEGYKEEIYAYGFRNPWKFSFDSQTGTLWCGDVGQNNWEEIDTVKNGGNYGWRLMEGNHCYNPSNCNSEGLELPVWEYSHQSGNCSVTGGYVYRGQEIPSLFGLSGKYIYGDYCSGIIWMLRISGTNQDSVINEYLFESPSSILSFGVDENDELYICCANGKIYKFAYILDSVDDEEINPNNFYILQNFPNPFNPQTKIKYNIPERSKVKINIINSLGENVSTIQNSEKSKGLYEIIWNASGNTSGIYYINIKAESLSSNKKFIKTIKAVYLK